MRPKIVEGGIGSQLGALWEHSGTPKMVRGAARALPWGTLCHPGAQEALPEGKHNFSVVSLAPAGHKLYMFGENRILGEILWAFF